MHRSVYLLLLPSLCAFLLESNNPQNSTGGQIVSGNHYLTMSSFLEAQQKQHRDTEELHKTMDNTISVLTSQLQRKLSDLEKKFISDVSKNESCRTVEDLEKMFLELKTNHTDMLSDLTIAKNENRKMKDQLSLLINETRHINERLKNIEDLKNIQSLIDLQTVKQDIMTINSQTAALSQNQFARNQDFLALYNETSSVFVQANNRLQHLESFRNVSLTNATIKHQLVTNRFVLIEDRLQHLEQYTNVSLTRLNTNTVALQTQITNNKRKVAIEACLADYQNQPPGYIVKFGNVKISIGISGISSFTSSGKFKCEYEGLYIVSVCLTALNSVESHGIYLNGNEYTSIYESDKASYHRGCNTVVINLHVNDMLWVQLIRHMSINTANSCIAIVMIK
ncbi:Hypothetical predicted protein [Mytilus galloprovincialis]|uniref:C1q domain-containing protein n=1 Tax=Mytilus galloprovincialis TaxID=29158 RepID=A0A8B6HJC6_MYTGA|nr:Hypothetical predicted protein [Mytilus galloprovincialis]